MANNFICYSLCFDESTDISDTAQVGIFIHGVNIRLNVTEKLLNLISIKGITIAENNCFGSQTSLEKKNILF